MKRIITHILFSLLSIGFFLSCGISSYAESYKGTVKNVPETEAEVFFVFDFTLKQKYDVTVIDPTGKYFNVSDDSTKIEVRVDKAVAGDYSYTIVANNADFNSSVSVVSSGKTLVSVGDSNPVVSENVSDFNMWFEDGDVVATWNYNGKVSITITDPARFHNLESGLEVNDNVYRREIPEDVDTIQFYIVPSTDSKTEGAGLTYTRQVVRKIAASVDYPETPVVSESSVILPISVDTSGITVNVYAGDYERGVTHHNLSTLKPVISKFEDIGKYSLEIPLISSVNNIVVAFIDENGNTVTSGFSYIRDMVAPKIDPAKISLDDKAVSGGYSTTENQVVISGYVTDEIATDVVGSVAAFYINGTLVELDNAGHFSYTQYLTLGNNDIVLRAVDESGLESEFTLPVVMQEKKSIIDSKTLIKALLLLAAVAIIVFLILAIRKKGKKPPKGPKETKVKKESSDKEKKSVEEKRKAELEKLRGGFPKNEDNKLSPVKEKVVEVKSPQKVEPVPEPKPVYVSKSRPEKKDSTADGAFKPILSIIDEELEYDDMSFFEKLKAKRAKKKEVNEIETNEREQKETVVAASVSSVNKASFVISVEEPLEEEFFDEEPAEEDEAEVITSEIDEQVEKPEEVAEDDDVSEEPEWIVTEAIVKMECFDDDEDEDVSFIEEPSAEEYVEPSVVTIEEPCVSNVNDLLEDISPDVKTYEEPEHAEEIEKPSVTPVVSEKAEKKKSRKAENFPKDNKYAEVSRKQQETIKKSEAIANRMRRRQNNAMLVRFAVELVVIIIFFACVVRNTVISSASMEPTLMTGDYAVYFKLAYKFTDVKRGDIVTFWSEEYNEYFSKRVIGIPGDKIEFHDGYVFINGVKADESAYLDSEMETNCIKKFEVPDGCVFVMGDNRENSHDSRFFLQPYIPMDDIEGKYIGTVPSFKKK